MAARGSNDFFLQFGSNAPAFSEELKSGLAGSVTEIEALKTALEQYEAVAGRLQGQGSPIKLNFEGLNQAANRIEEATTGFARKFGAQLTELTTKVSFLAETLGRAGRVAPGPVDTRVPAGGREVALPRAVQVVEQQRHQLTPLPPEPGTPSSPHQRPVPPPMPAVLESNDYPALPRHQDQEVRRDYYKKLNRFYDSNPGARDADIAYSEAMDEFNAQNKLFEARKKSWKQKAEQIRKENARLQALNAQLDAEAATATPVAPTSSTAPKATATPPAPAATQVTEAQLKEAEAARAAAHKNADAVTQVARDNEAIANNARVLAETLAVLNQRLQESTHKTPTEGKVTDATDQVGNEVQVGNTSSNPVPVLVVGAEEAKGHPKGKGHETGKATTATQQAADSETLGEAAALARTPEDVQNELIAARRAADNARHRTRRAVANPNRQDEVEGLLAQQEQAEAHREALTRELAASRAVVAPPPSGSNTEPETKAATPRGKKPVNLLGGATSSMDLETSADVKKIFDSLKQKTQDAILAARDALKNPQLSEADRQEAIVSAGAHFVEDPAAKALRLAPLKSRNFAGMLGLNTDDSGVRRLVTEVLNQHGPARNRAAANAIGGTGNEESAKAAENAERLARMQVILGSSTGRVREALLQQERAMAEANALMVKGETNASKLSAAYLNLARAGRAVQTAAAAQQKEEQPAAERGLYARLTNKPAGATLLGGLQRHGGMALENTIGYTLVFTGFEKLRELVHSGIEAEAVFVRLSAELKATGRSTVGVKDALMQISHDTASPIEHVIEAASELAGVFHKTSDLEFATGIASQLANISQGLLSAREAAIGLRDVTAAYGLQAPKEIQAVGDNIARLSQVTGVSVKDITEGTTQLAQEAHDFGLNQRQTSTLAAYITQGTGEPGEAAAEQASRLLSTLYNSRVQNVLVRNGVTSESKFQEGDIAGVLEDLVKKYGNLNPATRQELASQIGAGRQARAFAALTNGGENFVQEFTGGSAASDKGALARQNTAYLETIAGQMRQFKEDFENLGVSLQRAGVFDLLGLFAKGLDTVARSLSFLLNTFADVMDISPFTKEIGHLTVMILELVAASKLLGALTGGRVTLGAAGRGLGRIVGIGGGAAAAGAAEGGAAAAETGELSAFDAALAESVKVLEAFSARLLQASEAATANAAATTEEATAKQADATATGENAAAQQAGAVAAGENASAQQADAVAAGENAVAQQAGAVAVGGGGLGRGFTGAVARRPGFVSRLFGLRGAEARRVGEAGRAAAVAGEDAEGVRFARFAAGGPGALGGMGVGGALFGAGTTATLAIPAFALAGLAPAAFQAKDIGDRSNRGAAAALKIALDPTRRSQKDAQLASDAASQTGTLDWADKLGQNVGNVVVGLGGLFSPFGSDPGSDHPSKKSDRAATKLGVKYEKQLQDAIKDKSAEEIIKAQNDLANAIADKGSEIAKLGGNGKGAQADIASQLQDLKTRLQADGDKVLKNGLGIKTANEELSNVQATMMATFTQAVGSLSPQTIRANPGALRAMFQNYGGTGLGTKDYELEQNLAGFKTVQPSKAQMQTYDRENARYKAQLPQQQSAYDKNEAIYQKQLAAYNASKTHLRAEYTGQERTYDASEFNLDNLSKDQRTAVNRYLAGTADLPSGIPLKNGTTTQSKADQVQAAGGPKAPTPIGPPPTAPTPVVRRVELAPEEQQRDLAKLYQEQIKTFSDVVNGIDPKTHKEGKFTVEQKSTAFTALQQALQGFSQSTQASFDIPIQRGAAQASALTASGNYAGAGKALTSQKTGLQAYLGTLKATQPEYWQTLEQIHQVQLQIATTLNTPQMQRLALLAANSLNPLAAAGAAHQQALLGVKAAEEAYQKEVQDARDLIAADEKALEDYLAPFENRAGAPSTPKISGLEQRIAADKKALGALLGTGGQTPDKNAADAQAASTAASQAQAAEAVNAAQAAAKQAGIRNDVQKGRAQLAEALRLEAVYSGRGDKAGYYTAVAQAEQAQIAIKDAVEQQRESAINAAAALATRHGDAVGAARLGLKAAQDAYAYAVKEYGKNSQEAQSALAALYQAQQTEISAELEKQNAALDLDAARLTARGKSGDAEKAANDQVKKAQNAVNSYLRHGGKKGTADYDKLEGDLASARRSAFDTALQAQLDTLDFQRDTYKITSAQEVQSLQQILKNKQLTLKEQRDITLKIKDLQQSIREQLTQGGLNIPSDIKLPTAYEVRRSLGAGFSGSGTSVSTVNNNQQVTINNTVANSALVNQITSSVISAINQQTGQQLRANSSTPRLVTTR